MSVKKEKIDISKFNFGAEGFMPVIVQDYESGEVLTLAYVNNEAVEKTFSTGYTHFYDPSQKTVTKFSGPKGANQKVQAAFLKNDGASLLLKVKQKGNADCVNNTYSCFNDQIQGQYNDIGGEMFGRLQRILDEYKKDPQDGSYTSFLFVRGVDRIAKKVGEEAVEFVIASKNDEKQGVINEAADLLYHTMVLLNAKDVSISEVCAELCKRNR